MVQRRTESSDAPGFVNGDSGNKLTAAAANCARRTGLSSISTKISDQRTRQVMLAVAMSPISQTGLSCLTA